MLNYYISNEEKEQCQQFSEQGIVHFVSCLCLGKIVFSQTVYLIVLCFACTGQNCFSVSSFSIHSASFEILDLGWMLPSIASSTIPGENLLSPQFCDAT